MVEKDLIIKDNNQPLTDLISELESKKIKLWIENGALRYKAPKGVVNNEILKCIGDRKEEIVEYFLEKDERRLLYDPIEVTEEKDYYPLSGAQKRMYILNQIDKASTAYNITNVLKVEGELEKDRLAEVFDRIIDRHESLRTTFETQGESYVQKIHKKVDFKLEYLEIEGVEEQIIHLLEEFTRSFDLSIAPLLRIKLVKLTRPDNTTCSFILFDIHHIISDGMSASIIVKEFNDLYMNKNLPQLKIQYKDYAAWQEKLLSGRIVKSQKKHWLEQFTGELPVLDLLSDYPRPQKFTFKGQSVKCNIGREHTDKLYNLARENRITLYTVLLSAYYILLAKYTGQNDIIIGTPTAGRGHEDIQSLIGMFVNTLPLRNYPEPQKSLAGFLKEVGGNILKAFDNQDYPFEQLAEDLGIPRDTSRNPIFDTMFVLQNIFVDEVKADKLESSIYEISKQVAQFDITITATENKRGIDFDINYCSDLYKKETVERLARHYINILEKLIKLSPEAAIKDIDLLSEAERKQILYDFNYTASEYQKDKTIQELFEEQAYRTPDNIAVVFEGEQLTYRELNSKANWFARQLRDKGVGLDSIVGVMTGRSLEMIVGIMAVLKAGGAYLPINPDYPVERICYMLEDSGTEYILTQSSIDAEWLSTGNESSIKRINIEIADQSAEDDCNLKVINRAKDLAYIIYTSGSTGKPKGVMIENGSVVNLIHGLHKEIYSLYGSPLNIALVAPYIFDASVQQIFAALLQGHTLYIVPEKTRLDGGALLSYYAENSIDISDGTPTHISILVQCMEAFKKDIKVKHFIIGGEALPCAALNEFISKFDKEKPYVTNIYGPTECCVDATAYRIGAGGVKEFNVAPIGRPLANVKVYILGKNRELMPVGVPGEIFISGDGLARGYLNRFELTEEKFIENPFEAGKSMYCTGDLARWLPDGNIEFLGRLDYQVKIRGFRIELAEIEFELSKHEAIKGTIVIDKEDADGNKYLCAYFESDEELTVSQLREFLSQKLPAYMIPAVFVKIDKIPLTTNGKIDRKSLPEPDGSINTGVEYSEPTNRIEKELAAMWEGVLGLKEIGINHNFFDIGGDSIRLVSLHNKIEKVYPGIVSVADLFSYSTIAELAAYIESSMSDSSEKEDDKDDMEDEEGAYRLILENALSGNLSEKDAIKAIKTLKQIQKKQEDIAVIGISVNLPRAKNIEELWDVIANKVDCIRELPEERRKDLNNYLCYKKVDTSNTKYLKMSYLESIDKFDYNFFGVSPREASLMDPNQRLFLQTAWNAAEDAGYGGKLLTGTRTGVYLGFSSDSEYGRMLWETTPELFPIFVAGNLTPIIASRISYLMDLKGPSLLINTTCSSSLVAIHYACQDIRNGQCDMAIAGGVKINLVTIEDESKMGIEASDGRTKAFDDSSDGTGRGEGVAAVMLKSLSKALKDRDNIYAIIKGSSVNQDGSSNGITAPNPKAQTDVIKKAWKEAKIDPETIEYIEAHGTGTKLGDPIEIDGITRAFKGVTSKSQFCAVSSVKSNMGHMDNVAGILGFIKAVLALKNRELPPSVHFNNPNMAINFINSPVYVNDRLKKWEADQHPRRCGVSSFGLSGTNCHMVLEEAPEVKADSSDSLDKFNVLTISAKTKETLFELINLFKENFSRVRGQGLKNVCFTANTGRGHYKYRLAIVLEEGEALADKLNMLEPENITSNRSRGIFYGEHEVTGAKEAKTGNEINEAEKQKLSKDAAIKVSGFLNSGKQSRDSLFDLCTLYTVGAEVEWSSLYKDEKNKRVSIPVYPFMKIRCWADIKNANDGSSSIAELSPYFSVVWECKELKEEDNHHDITIVLKDNKGLGDSIIKKLHSKGRKAIGVSMGSSFEKTSSFEYTIPNTQQGYEKLLSQAIETKGSIQLVHMSTLCGDGEISTIDELAKIQGTGVKSLFYLVRAVLNCNIDTQVDIVLVADYVNGITADQKVINPEHAAMFGLGKVTGQEYANISCRCLDIDELTGADEILGELGCKPDEHIVGYRNRKRYVERIEEKRFDSSEGKKVDIKEDGVYIVTGGLGGLGLEICKSLASKKNVNLLLLNRTQLPEPGEWDKVLAEKRDTKLCKKIAAVKSIENMGSKISLYSIDISDFNKMKALFGIIKDQYGRVDGVIHCAGLAGDGFIINKEETKFDNVLSPKIYGTWNLDRVTESFDMDFFIVFSSLASLTGSPGQGDYTSANSYQDSFSAYRNRKGIRTAVINWPAWKEVGMAVDYGTNVDGFFKTITTEKGIEVFYKVLESDTPRLVVGEINLKDGMGGFADQRALSIFSKEILEKIGNSMKKAGEAQSKRVEYEMPEVKLHGRKSGVYSETEKSIGKVWGHVLGLSEAGIYDDFFEVGGNSLLAVEFTTKLGKALGKNVLLQAAFENPTIEQMGKCFKGDSEVAPEAEEDYEEIRF